MIEHHRAARAIAKRHTLRRALAVVIALFVSSADGIAQTLSAAEYGALRLNLAGRQRMLSQRIPKAACFATASTDQAAQLNELREAYGLFDQTIKALQQGSTEPPIAAEDDPALLEQLQQAKEYWRIYTDAFATIVDGSTVPIDAQKLDVVLQNSIPLLLALEDYVALLELKYSKAAVLKPALAQAINVAGRQRMLSQKMSKEFCQIATNRDADLHRKYLLGTLALADSAHRELLATLPELGLQANQLAAVSAQLTKVGDHWRRFRPGLETVSKGGAVDPAMIEQICTESRAMLDALNQAVELYLQAAMQTQ